MAWPYGHWQVWNGSEWLVVANSITPLLVWDGTKWLSYENGPGPELKMRGKDGSWFTFSSQGKMPGEIHGVLQLADQTVIGPASFAPMEFYTYQLFPQELVCITKTDASGFYSASGIPLNTGIGVNAQNPAGNWYNFGYVTCTDSDPSQEFNTVLPVF